MLSKFCNDHLFARTNKTMHLSAPFYLHAYLVLYVKGRSMGLFLFWCRQQRPQGFAHSSVIIIFWSSQLNCSSLLHYTKLVRIHGFRLRNNSLNDLGHTDGRRAHVHFGIVGASSRGSYLRETLWMPLVQVALWQPKLRSIQLAFILNTFRVGLYSVSWSLWSPFGGRCVGLAVFGCRDGN